MRALACKHLIYEGVQAGGRSRRTTVAAHQSKMYYKLYYGEMSSYSSVARLILAEKGLTPDMHLIDLFKGDHLEPSYLKLNPKAEVPTLLVRKEGVPEEVIPGSSAITRRLEEPDVGVKSLVPASEAAAAWRWLEEAHTLPSYVITFGDVTADKGQSKGAKMVEGSIAKMEKLAREHPDMAHVAHAKIERMKARSGRWSQKDLDEAWAKFDAFFGAMDQELQKTKAAYICGEEYSIADAHITPFVARVAAMGSPELISKHPALQAWWERIQARPSYKTVFPKGPK